MIWYPVATAPQDGTWVLLSGGLACDESSEGDSNRPVVAKWHAPDQAWVFSYWDGEWRGTYENPTHWAK